jgi:hypothetical protein
VSVCLCVSVCLFVCLSVFLFVCFSVCLFICLSVCLSVCPTCDILSEQDGHVEESDPVRVLSIDGRPPVEDDPSLSDHRPPRDLGQRADRQIDDGRRVGSSLESLAIQI